MSPFSWLQKSSDIPHSFLLDVILTIIDCPLTCVCMGGVSLARVYFLNSHTLKYPKALIAQGESLGFLVWIFMLLSISKEQGASYLV